VSLPTLYKKSPVLFQNLLVSFRGYQIQRSRYNQEFYRFLNRFENNDPSKIDITQLKTFIERASHSPFWEKRFEKYMVDIDADDLISEIHKLPILTKEEVRDNVDQILNPSIPKKNLNKVQTSGTTGTGLIFHQTQSMENAQWSVWWRYRKWHGINPDLWMGWFGGKMIIDRKVNKPPFWRINLPGKQVMFSPIHLSEDTASHYYEEIKRRDLKWLHGYPSQLSLLAGFILEEGWEPLSAEYITIGSENLTDHQKEQITAALGTRPLQHYGLAEGVANISESPKGTLIPDQDFAYTEFIHHMDNQYKIVGTNYHNIAFPLIRYDTSDLATLDENGNIVRIDGREDDYILLPSGEKIGRVGFIFQEATFVKEAQIYQKSIDTLVLRIVKGRNYQKDHHESFLREKCRERFGSDLHIKFEYWDQIPRTTSGKLRLVISDLEYDS